MQCITALKNNKGENMNNNIDPVKQEQLQKELEYLRNAPTKKEMLAEYESNRRKASQLQADILKGANAGEDIYTLFLQAVQVISLMTGNVPYYEQIKADIMAVYGIALQEPQALNVLLDAVQNRINKLDIAINQQGLDTADKARIQTALNKNKEQKEQIKNKMGQV